MKRQTVLGTSDSVTDVTVSRPTQHKIGHYGDVLPIQSLGLVLKKLNLTQQKQTDKDKMAKKHKKQT